MIAGLVVGAALVVGCGKNAPSTGVPGDGAAAEATTPDSEEPLPADDELSSYERELVGHEDRLLSLGLPLAGGVTATRTSEGRNSLPMTDGGGDAGGPRCERICELATNICELQDRICDLGREHPGERRYQAVCERATLDCERATEACEGCDGEG